jgi:hypothetical protein
MTDFDPQFDVVWRGYAVDDWIDQLRADGRAEAPRFRKALRGYDAAQGGQLCRAGDALSRRPASTMDTGRR